MEPTPVDFNTQQDPTTTTQVNANVIGTQMQHPTATPGPQQVVPLPAQKFDTSNPLHAFKVHVKLQVIDLIHSLGHGEDTIKQIAFYLDNDTWATYFESVQHMRASLDHSPAWTAADNNILMTLSGFKLHETDVAQMLLPTHLPYERLEQFKLLTKAQPGTMKIWKFPPHQSIGQGGVYDQSMDDKGTVEEMENLHNLVLARTGALISLQKACGLKSYGNARPAPLQGTFRVAHSHLAKLRDSFNASGWPRFFRPLTNADSVPPHPDTLRREAEELVKFVKQTAYYAINAQITRIFFPNVEHAQLEHHTRAPTCWTNGDTIKMKEALSRGVDIGGMMKIFSGRQKRTLVRRMEGCVAEMAAEETNQAALSSTIGKCKISASQENEVQEAKKAHYSFADNTVADLLKLRQSLDEEIQARQSIAQWFDASPSPMAQSGPFTAPNGYEAPITGAANAPPSNDLVAGADEFLPDWTEFMQNTPQAEGNGVQKNNQEAPVTSAANTLSETPVLQSADEFLPDWMCEFTQNGPRPEDDGLYDHIDLDPTSADDFSNFFNDDTLYQNNLLHSGFANPMDLQFGTDLDQPPVDDDTAGLDKPPVDDDAASSEQGNIDPALL